VQLYRGFDIGSAKVGIEGRQRIPHHLIDVLNPEDVCSAGEYARMARAATAEIAARGRLPVIAGGTGFYIQAFLEGLFAGPQRDSALRSELARREAKRKGFLWRALRRFDQMAAQRIHPNDRNKMLRALEVYLLSRRPMSEMLAAGREPLKGYIPLKLLLDPPRSGLYSYLDERCLRIFDGGLMEEVRGLLARGVPAGAKPFESIGYKQALRFVRGEISRDDALAEMRRDTRRYAKRQLTWWRRDDDVVRVSGFGTDESVVRSILDTVSRYLLTFNRSE
jgi:tRNA dimethylallyltransferase